jgi:hypothetical protein
MDQPPLPLEAQGAAETQGAGVGGALPLRVLLLLPPLLLLLR